MGWGEGGCFAFLGVRALGRFSIRIVGVQPTVMEVILGRATGVLVQAT